VNCFDRARARTSLLFPARPSRKLGLWHGDDLVHHQETCRGRATATARFARPMPAIGNGPDVAT
jgi:hypothetical protein